MFNHVGLSKTEIPTLSMSLNELFNTIGLSHNEKNLLTKI